MLQQSPETLAAPHGYIGPTLWVFDGGEQQHIALALMIAFCVMMYQVFPQGAPQ
jgi:hypothetical protein